MVLRNITVDNSARYIPKSEQTKEKNVKPKTIKVGQLCRKQNRNISQNSKKFIENIAAGAFEILKRIMNCYF